MKSSIHKKLLIALVAIIGITVGKHSLAQTQVSIGYIGNLATLTFDVGADTGLTLNSSPTGNADLSNSGADTEFKVDRKIDLSISLTGSATAVPGEDEVIVQFSVQNDTNDVMDFILLAEVAGTGLTLANTLLPNPGGSGSALNDADDVASFSVFVDGDDNDAYDPLVDTAVTINDLASGDDVEVFVVVDLDNTSDMAADDYLFVSLVARAADATSGSLIAADSNGYQADNSGQSGIGDIDDPDIVDNVFAENSSLLAYDGASFEANDDARNGQISEHGLIVIENGLEVTKTVDVIYDPLNQSSNPKAIPEAYLQYTLTIENQSSGTNFTLTEISDELDVTLALDPGLLNTTCVDATSDTADPAAPEFSPNSSDCDNLQGSDYTQVDTSPILQATYNGGGGAGTYVAYFDNALLGGSSTVGVEYNSGSRILTVDIQDVILSSVFSGATITTPGELAASESLVLVFNAILQ
jgi:hypothetical protein